MTIWILLLVLLVVAWFVIPTGQANRKSIGVDQKPVEKRGLFPGAHDCGLRALLSVVPDLSPEQVEDAFMQCTDKWPNGGVSNSEYNVALRYMNIFDKFEYDDTEGQCAGDFTSDKENSYILLIYGHFTSVIKGRVKDVHYNSLSSNSKVFCSWKLTR